MKIVNISGGLGNQMFQYAFAMALKFSQPSESIYVDIQHYNSLFFKRIKGVNLHFGYEISKVFSEASLPIASPIQLMSISYYIPNYILSRIGRKLLPRRKKEYIPPYSKNYIFDEEALGIKGDCYYEGYWQSIKYYKDIKDELLKIFTHPDPNEYNRGLIKKIQSENSVGLHIRRGDYLAEPEFRGICGVEYYRRGLEVIFKEGEEHSFYIFSNDILWCRENIAPLVGKCKIEYVMGNSGEDSFWDMFLMSYCKNLIIANSSFSWWGAFLGKSIKKVIAPYPWLHRACEVDIYDDSWTLISND